MLILEKHYFRFPIFGLIISCVKFSRRGFGRKWINRKTGASLRSFLRCQNYENFRKLSFEPKFVKLESGLHLEQRILKIKSENGKNGKNSKF